MSKAGTAKVKAKKSEINDGEEVLQVLSCCSHRKASFVGFTLPPQAPDPARGGRPCPAYASRIARHLVPHCLAMSSIVGSWWASFAFPHAQRLVRRAVRFPRFALSGTCPRSRRGANASRCLAGWCSDEFKHCRLCCWLTPSKSAWRPSTTPRRKSSSRCARTQVPPGVRCSRA